MYETGIGCRNSREKCDAAFSENREPDFHCVCRKNILGKSRKKFLAKLFWEKFGEADYQLSWNFREWNFAEGSGSRVMMCGSWGVLVIQVLGIWTSLRVATGWWKDRGGTWGTLKVFSGIFFLYDSYKGLFREIGSKCPHVPPDVKMTNRVELMG